jgi:hypothetical protein
MRFAHAQNMQFWLVRTDQALTQPGWLLSLAHPSGFRSMAAAASGSGGLTRVAAKVGCRDTFSWHAARIAPPYTRRAVALGN